MFNMILRIKGLFLDLGGFVLERSEMTTIVLDVRVNGARITMRIQMTAIRVVKLFVVWVVHEKAIGCGSMVD